MGSDVLQRVSFRFGPEREVRYVTQVPEVGDYVAHGSLIWIVSEVHVDDLGALVTCEQPEATRA